MALMQLYWSWHLLVIFKIFKFSLDFVHKKSNSNEICKEILFPFTFLKNAKSALFSDFKPNYLEKLRGYPLFSFWILIALDKIFFSRLVIGRAKKPRY